MELTKIRNGSCFNSSDLSTSYYFLSGETMFIIDCSFEIFKALIENDDFKKYKHFVLMITHTHEDHVSGLASLLFYFEYVKTDSDIEVIGDENDVPKYLDAVGYDDDICFTSLTNTYCYKDNNVKIMMIKTEHVKQLNCYGFDILFSNGDNIYYSGDSTILPSVINKKIKNTVLYQDATVFKGGVHMFIDEAEKIGKQAKDVHLIHLD